MKAVVSIIMGSTSDLHGYGKSRCHPEEMEIPFEMNALSAHRTPDEVEKFAKNANRWHQSDHCRCRNGSSSSRCYRCYDTYSSDWRSY